MKTHNTNTKYGTLLARKCIASGNDDEIQAILGLNPKIDWLSDFSHKKNLVEGAFSYIQNSDTFKDYWSKISHDLQIGIWDNGISDDKDMASLPFIGWALIFEKIDTLKDWVAKDKGTPNQWARMLSVDAFSFFTLSSGWENVEKNAISIGLDSKFLDAVSKYREKHLWLKAKTLEELQNLSPKTWNPAQSFLWYKHAMNDYSLQSNHSASNAWLLSSFLSQKDAWSNWSDDNWNDAINLTPPGFLNYNTSKFKNHLDAKGLSKDLKEFSNILSSKVNFQSYVLEVEELLLVGSTIQRSVYQRFKARPTSEFLIYKKWASNCKDNLLTKTPKSSEDNALLGLMLANIDTMAFKRTSISDRAMQFLGDKNFTLPKDYAEVFNLISKDTYGVLKSKSITQGWMDDMAVTLSHILKAYEDRKDIKSMKAMVDSISLPVLPQDESLTGNKKQDDNLAVSLAKWAQRMGSASSTKEASREWAQLFWRSIFSMESATQHYWLKKVSKDKYLQVDLRFWNDDFSELMDKRLSGKKGTPDIHALLSKMTILNQINQVVPIGDRASRRKSKI